MNKLQLHVANDFWHEWAQLNVVQSHYLHTPVHPASQPLTYVITYKSEPHGCLTFGRTEATRCFTGALTYGDVSDVEQGRAIYTRWEILSLQRVWLHPHIQSGGIYCTPTICPGYYDRTGEWRSSAASSIIRAALDRVGYDYLVKYPPVWIEQPYQIRVVSSYCDTRIHRGIIYRAAGFDLARMNADGIETWYTHITPLTDNKDRTIRKIAMQSERSKDKRRKATNNIYQEMFS